MRQVIQTLGVNIPLIHPVWAALFCVLILPLTSSAMKDVSIRDYGGHGNELKDDTDAFQLALDDVVAAGGGRIFVPRGDYIISKRISMVVPNEKIKASTIKIAIVGEGPAHSRLMSTSTEGLLHFETPRSSMDITVKDLALMAQKPGAGTALRILSHALGGVRVERAVVIENVLISGIYDSSYFEDGISLSGQWRPLIRNVEVRGAVSESLADDSPAFAMKAGIKMEAFYAGRIVRCVVKYAHTGFQWIAAENGEGFVIMDSQADHVRVGAVIATPEQEPGGCLVRSRIRARDIGLRIDHKRLLAVIDNDFISLSDDGSLPLVDISVSNSWVIQINRNRFLGSPLNRTHVAIDGRSEIKNYVIMPFSKFIQINGNEMLVPSKEAVKYQGHEIFEVSMEENRFPVKGRSNEKK